MTEPLESLDYTGDLDLALEFLKPTRWPLRALRKAHVYPALLRVFDVNEDYFELGGIGSADADIVPLLGAVNTAFAPHTIQVPTAAEYKEFFTGRRHAWAEDRVM